MARIQDDRNERSYSGRTGLYLPSLFGHIDIANVLLDFGANVYVDAGIRHYKPLALQGDQRLCKYC